MSGVVYGLLNLDVQFLASNCFRNDVAGLTPIRIRTTARTGLLRIAAVVFDQPKAGSKSLK